MKFSVRNLIEDMSGRADRRFVRLLLVQLDTTLAGARLVRDVVTGQDEQPEGLRSRIRELEREGDEKRERVVVALSNALVTPIDREDLFRFSGGIDEILDNLRDFGREWDLYGMRRTDFFGPLLDDVLEGLGKLRKAAEFIVDEPASIAVGAMEAKRAGNRIRRNYQVTVAKLFDEADGRPVTVDVLKRRELLRRLDVVGLRIRETAELLADAAVKRSH